MNVIFIFFTEISVWIKVYKISWKINNFKNTIIGKYLEISLIFFFIFIIYLHTNTDENKLSAIVIFQKTVENWHCFIFFC